MLAYKLINFLTFAALLFVFIRNPLKEWWGNRRLAIEKTIGDVANLFARTSQESEKWRKLLSGVEDDFIKVIDDYKKEGDLERFNIVDMAEKYANKIRTDAALAARHEMDVAVNEIRVWAAKEAVLAAKLKISKESTQADRELFLSLATKEVENSL